MFVKVEFRYEYAPLKIPLFVEKDSKSKEVTPLPTPKIVKIACGPNHTVAIDENCKVRQPHPHPACRNPGILNFLGI